MNILLAVIISMYLFWNFAVSKALSTSGMKRRFIDGQCFIGKIATNLFYAPAWILKAIRFVVLLSVK